MSEEQEFVTNILQKLSPCPFDGADAFLFHNGRAYVAKCTGCQAKIVGRTDTKQEVIDAWERRHD